jgi:hypothetical protein
MWPGLEKQRLKRGIVRWCECSSFGELIGRAAHGAASRGRGGSRSDEADEVAHEVAHEATGEIEVRRGGPRRLDSSLVSRIGLGRGILASMRS